MASDPGDEGGQTVVDRPGERSGEATVQLKGDEPPAPAPLALVAAGMATPHPAGQSRTLQPGTMSITSARDAMRDEEIERTRTFIAGGWAISVVAAVAVLFMDAPPALVDVFIGGLGLGVIVSARQYIRLANPANYTERGLVGLAVVAVFNGHMAVLLFGTFSGVVLMVVMGVHFIARTELDRVARWIFATALVTYAGIATLVVTGVIADPGVFAADRSFDRATLVTGAVFVLGCYVLAYHTARAARATSLVALDRLHGATRLASQREALMDELRADLERALQVGGPGRYTDETIGVFRLGIVLGRGAMGEVYEAAHVETGAPAAVKLLRRELLSDATQVARFLREVRASGALDSPHVVRVIDASAEGSGLPYLAMERLRGHTLAALLRDQGRLLRPELVAMWRQVAIGLDAAAAAGIVHRDLKPQNLHRSDDGTWKILDFGVATLSADTGTLTHGDIVGTPHYMAPEQARGQRVDARADVYSLGAIAYRCATGRHPFAAGDTPSLLYQVVNQMPPRPGALAELPGDVDRAFAIALAKSPEERFASGIELADALTAALAGELDPKLRKRGDALIRKYPWEAA
jgi:serine/threonine-protein kinase